MQSEWESRIPIVFVAMNRHSISTSSPYACIFQRLLMFETMQVSLPFCFFCLLFLASGISSQNSTQSHFYPRVNASKDNFPIYKKEQNKVKDNERRCGTSVENGRKNGRKNS